MADEPAPPPQASAKPGIFQNINGVIAGLTGLVIALGSLAAAWTTIFPKKEEAKQEQVAELNQTAATEDEAATDETAVTEAAAKYTGNLYKDRAYEGDAVTLEDNGEYWLLTVGDNDPVYYKQVKSPYSDWIMAYSRDKDDHLQWPMAGGELQKGDGEADKFGKYAWVDPEAPAEEAAAEEPAAE